MVKIRSVRWGQLAVGWVYCFIPLKSQKKVRYNAMNLDVNGVRDVCNENFVWDGKDFSWRCTELYKPLSVRY